MPAKKYSIITYGCQMNESDSEKIAASLEKRGYRAAKKETADLIVLNVCSVRQSAVDRVYSRVKQIHSKQPKTKIILTGCLLKKDKKHLEKQVNQIWPIISLESKAQHKHPDQAYIPIMTGCDNFCSYCVVPYTRGRERSRPAQDIVDEVKKLARRNCRQIVLLGQNVNKYQCGKTDFPKLLQKISRIGGNFKIKFLTSHPHDMSDKLIEVIAKNKKIIKEIHLPVQSGDNQILKKMNRAYTAENYKKLVEKIKKKIPNIRLSTDIIVGFPSETKRQFENTVKLIKEIGFCQIFAAAYSPRPGTAAARLKDSVPPKEKKRRKKIILQLSSSELNNKKPPLIVVLGPNASGKSSLAIKLAKKFNGEIVSADSRQVYQGLDIGSGKITKTEQKIVPHYLLDVVKPKTHFTLAQYQKLALQAIDDILKRDKLPFLVGGTGLYIQAICENLAIPKVKANKNLRKKLETLTLQQLRAKCKGMDPKGYEYIDRNNPRRLIRAIEVVKATGQSFWQQRQKKEPEYKCLKLGLTHPRQVLERRIKLRTAKRLKKGWIKEVKRLLEAGISYQWFFSIGLGYSRVAQYLKDKLTKKELPEAILKEELVYAKRQMTWFKKDKNIYWIDNQKQAEKLVKNFLSGNLL